MSGAHLRVTRSVEWTPKTGISGGMPAPTAARIDSENIHAQHPPYKEERDGGDDQVANPLPHGPGFRPVVHGAMVAGWLPNGAGQDRGYRYSVLG